MSGLLSHLGVAVKEHEIIKHMSLDAYAKLKQTFVKTVYLKHNVVKSHRMVNIVKTQDATGAAVTILVVPRFLAFHWLKMKYLTNIVNKLPDCLAYDYPNKTTFGGQLQCTPYPIQSVLHYHIVNHLLSPDAMRAGSAGAILELEAGYGKTYIAGMVAYTLGVRTLYVVHNEYLLDQAVKDISCIMPSAKIGKYYTREKSWGDIQFMIINSVTSDTFTIDKISYKPHEYFAHFGLTIWDEIHEYCTERNSKAMVRASTPYMLGITAEANSRLDKMDVIAHVHCGPVFKSSEFQPFIDEMNKCEDAGERYLSKCVILKYVGPPTYTQNLINDTTQMMQMSKMVRQIIQDPHRFQLILNCAIKFYKEDKNFFIWTDMREMVSILQDSLAEYGIVAEAPEISKDTSTLMGGGSRKDAKTRVARAQTARVIVATYQYAYRGISLPKFDAMIFATPRRSHMYQTLKRIFRLGGDVGVVREIYDIVDSGTKLKNQLSSRMIEYRKELFNMTISEERVVWSSMTLDPSISAILSNNVKKYMAAEHHI